ncbi:MAG: hypothetical protein Q4D29_01520 [Lachnospiraceae bacterium]|nr:hypothetical protein [Lachnospiraceae bacterium]
MINFDEEIKKFAPSLEVDQVENEVINENGSDMTDALLALIEQNKQLELRLRSQVQVMPIDPGTY